jgi:arylsulfatase
MLTRRDFLQRAAAGTAVLAAPGLLRSASTNPSRRPNVVMILCDDMGFSDVGAYGGEIATPNLDGIAKGGVRFLQCHNTSKCFPSRACLLTGTYAQQCNMHRGGGAIKNAVTFGELLRPAGYRTYAVGKHHGNENLRDRGFDHYWGLRGGACNYFNPGTQRPGEPKPAYKRTRTWCFDEKVLHPWTPEDKDFYTTDAFTDWAIDFLQTDKDSTKPFFLYLAYNAPHDPLHAWPKDIAKYKGKYDAGFEAVRKARYAKQRRAGLLDDAYPLSDPTYKPWDALSPEERADQARRMEVYAAMIDRVDQNLGRLFQTLKDLGQWDNTLILFASDNGASSENVNKGTGPIGSMSRWASQQGNWANVSNTPFRLYKNWSHEGGTCTPLIAHWPAGIARPDRTDETSCHFIDVLPTVADLCGAEYPDEHNGQRVNPSPGVSLAPILRGGSIRRAEPLFFDWGRGKAVIDGQWKLVANRRNRFRWELYDITVDRTETNDLADKHPDRVKAMAARHEQWLKRCAEQRQAEG